MNALPIRRAGPLLAPPRRPRPPRRLVPKKFIRLGDRLATVAQPVKTFLLRYGPPGLRRRLEHCKCAQRQAWLNSILP